MKCSNTLKQHTENCKPRSSWNECVINIAKVTSSRSSCVTIQVGAVIVKYKQILSTGYNGTVSGFTNCDEKFDIDNYDKTEHHKWSSALEVHAEMNALMSAAKNRTPLDGATIHCTHILCSNCLKHMIQVGIKK